LNPDKVNQIAQYLYEAELKQTAVEKITNSKQADLSVHEAYQIQQRLNQLKKTDGYRIYAPKLGLTSPAKMAQMQVDHPIYGYVFYYMLMKNNEKFSLSGYIQPRVEPEIAVVLKNDLKGPGITLQDVEDSFDYAVSSLEILDSRYQNYKFTLPDVIADNTSAKGAVYSEKQVKLEPKALVTETVQLKINGEVKAEGDGSAVLGNPLETIVFLANELGKQGKVVPGKTPIMTGGMTEAIPIKAGDLIEVEYSTLENITVKALK